MYLNLDAAAGFRNCTLMMPTLFANLLDMIRNINFSSGSFEKRISGIIYLLTDKGLGENALVEWKARKCIDNEIVYIEKGVNNTIKIFTHVKKQGKNGIFLTFAKYFNPLGFHHRLSLASYQFLDNAEEKRLI